MIFQWDINDNIYYPNVPILRDILYQYPLINTLNGYFYCLKKILLANSKIFIKILEKKLTLALIK